MLRPLLAVLVVLPCLAWASSCCSGADRAIVLSQWYAAFNSKQSGNFKLILGREIFKKFLALDKTAAGPLARVKPDDLDSTEFKAHAMRVLGGLDRVINELDNQAALKADLDHLADQHQARKGVTRAQFENMGKVLRELLPTVLTDYNADAWDSCLKVLGDGITANLG